MKVKKSLGMLNDNAPAAETKTATEEKKKTASKK